MIAEVSALHALDHDDDARVVHAGAAFDGLVGAEVKHAFDRGFGQALGDPDFNAALDHQGDGAIGLLDFASFRQTFGEAR